MQEIRKYNHDKINNILEKNAILPTIDAPKILINFIPFDAFTRQTYLDLAKSNLKINFPEQRINFDGLLAYQMNDKGINSYAQIHRNGIIEFLSSSNKVFDIINNPFVIANNLATEKLKIIYGEKNGFEYYLIRKSYEFINILKKLKVQTPIYIFISIIDAKGYRILYKNNNEEKITNAIDRNILSIPELELKRYDNDLKPIIRMAFNMIWNACGEKESINFDNQGHWLGEKIEK